MALKVFYAAIAYPDKSSRTANLSVQYIVRRCGQLALSARKMAMQTQNSRVTALAWHLSLCSRVLSRAFVTVPQKLLGGGLKPVVQPSEGIAAPSAVVRNAAPPTAAAIPLWPPSDGLTAPKSTGSMLTYFRRLISASGRYSDWPVHCGAVLVLPPSPESTTFIRMARETAALSAAENNAESAALELANLLRMPLFRATEEAPAGSSTKIAQRLKHAVANSQLHAHAAQGIHLTVEASFLLIVCPQTGLYCAPMAPPSSSSEIETERNYSLRDFSISEGLIRVDFLGAGGPKNRYKMRGLAGFDDSAPLVQACFSGLPRIHHENEQRVPVRILDLTAGAGIDSFLLASFGAKVTMIEQDVIFALLVLDGLRRATVARKNHEGIGEHTGRENERRAQEAVSRMKLILGDSAGYLASLLAGTEIRETNTFDVLYADPFYPEAEPSALSAVSGSNIESRTNAKARSGKKKHIALARALWDATEEWRTKRAVSADVTAGVSDAGRVTVTKPPDTFYHSSQNLELFRLLSAACGLVQAGKAARVALKHPATAYAQRLLLEQMPFAIEKSFQSRDTTYHIIKMKDNTSNSKTRGEIKKKKSK